MKRPLHFGTARALVFIFALVTAGCMTSGPKKRGHIKAGNQYARDGLYREAVENYKKTLSKRPKHPTAHRNLGMVLVKMGDYKRAASHLEKSMKRYSDNFDANFYLGEAYRGQNKYSEAIFRYKKALKVKKNDPRVLKPLAWSYFKIRYYSKALTTGRKLAKVASRDDQSAIILARTLLKLKRPREALATLREAKANIQPKSRAYYLSVEGDILAEKGNFKKAAKVYRKALKKQPLLAGALLGLGRCFLASGKRKPAIKYMERAVRVRPELTEGHYLLGRAYEKINPKKSLRYYRHFRQQAAADPEYLGLMDDVKKRIGSLRKGRNNGRG